MGNCVAGSRAVPPALASAPPSELATFGAGCFWGTERYFQKLAAAHPGGIRDMRVGFMGGPEATPNPSYKARTLPGAAPTTHPIVGFQLFLVRCLLLPPARGRSPWRQACRRAIYAWRACERSVRAAERTRSPL